MMMNFGLYFLLLKRLHKHAFVLLGVIFLLLLYDSAIILIFPEHIPTLDFVPHSEQAQQFAVITLLTMIALFAVFVLSEDGARMFLLLAKLRTHRIGGHLL